MFDKLSGKFVPMQTASKFVTIILISFFTLTSIIPLRAASRQNSPVTSTATSDANSVGLQSTDAQEAVVTDASEQITLKKLQENRKRINESQTLSDEDKTKIVEIYDIFMPWYVICIAVIQAKM